MIILWLLCVWAKRNLDAKHGMPKENELANSCYFTYRMAFILCDPQQTTEEASAQMKRGECHKDYFLTASHFQHHVNMMYSAGHPPPLEEIYWILSLPQDFQQGTWKECPGIMIVAYLAAAEAGVTLFGPQATFVKEYYMMTAQMVHTMKYKDIVFKSWPIEKAFASFQRRISATEELMFSLIDRNSTYATIVLCHEGAEDIFDWISTFSALPPRSKVLIRTPLHCQDPASAQYVFCESVPMCTPFGLPWDSDFVVFLPSKLDKRPKELFDLVFESLRHMTYDVSFLHLGFERVIPVLTPCQADIYERIMHASPRMLSTYRGSHMVIRGNMTAPLEWVCPEGYGDGLWGPLFLGSSVVPLHADDHSLPRCFRLQEDQTRIPRRQLFLESIRKPLHNDSGECSTNADECPKE
eukprot:GEMP01049590.1.p1 GENE.GEMP01049590.1~~GEMP01049590.1.p1  ORF type:complete len:411 (+),score=88.06 GEMP01049590.1:216-1448(+)